ncbi:MAG: hypothetical protein RTU92_12880 [Candidatus Thorarchaeota archaeon]
MAFDIVQFLLGPAEILTQGMVGLILGLGMNALQIWLMYEIVVKVSPRAENLVDVIDMELSQTQFTGGMKYRLYTITVQVCLTLVLISMCYLVFYLISSSIRTLL